MSRLKHLLATAGLTAGMLLGITSTAHAGDWDRDHGRDGYEQRSYDGDYWRDRQGRYYRRVWDPYRGWVVMRFYPEPPAWEGHDRGRHRGWYKHHQREWHDGDDDWGR